MTPPTDTPDEVSVRRLFPAIVAVAAVATACSGAAELRAQDANAALGTQTEAVTPVSGSTGAGSPASADTDVAGAVDGTATVDDVLNDVADGGGADTVEVGASSEPARPVVEALWWQAETLDGAVLDATKLAGQDVVLWMWAPWCSVCNREAPDVARALAELPDHVTIIGVAGRDDVGPMREFVAEHGLKGMQHVVDEDGSLWESYGISYQPAWVFIAADGEASVAAGAIGYEGLFAGIDQVFHGS